MNRRFLACWILLVAFGGVFERATRLAADRHHGRRTAGVRRGRARRAVQRRGDDGNDPGAARRQSYRTTIDRDHRQRQHRKDQTRTVAAADRSGCSRSGGAHDHDQRSAPADPVPDRSAAPNRFPINRPVGPAASAWRSRTRRQAAAPPPQMSSEALGNRQILGLRAEGTRQTMTIPAGVFGNVGPIQVVTERWHSPELKIVLESRRSDPRLGDVTYRVTSLVRGEPDAALFAIPSDYTTVERPPRPFGPPPR